MIARVRCALRRWIKSQSATYLAVARWRRRPYDGSHRSITRDTQIVIDGFPRSANTYATHAFRLGQSTDVSIGHHFHAAGAVKAAVRRGLPTIVLIRQPREAVVSLMAHVDVDDAMELTRDYVSYYRSVLPVLGRTLVAPFPWVVQDFASVVTEVNARWGLSFAPPVRDDDAISSELRRIEERLGARRRSGEGHTHPAHREPRFERRARGHAAFESSANETSRLNAEAVYREVMAYAPAQHADHWRGGRDP